MPSAHMAPTVQNPTQDLLTLMSGAIPTPFNAVPLASTGISGAANSLQHMAAHGTIPPHDTPAQLQGQASAAHQHGVKRTWAGAFPQDTLASVLGAAPRLPSAHPAIVQGGLLHLVPASGPASAAPLPLGATCLPMDSLPAQQQLQFLLHPSLHVPPPPAPPAVLAAQLQSIMQPAPSSSLPLQALPLPLAGALSAPGPLSFVAPGQRSPTRTAAIPSQQPQQEASGGDVSKGSGGSGGPAGAAGGAGVDADGFPEPAPPSRLRKKIKIIQPISRAWEEETRHAARPTSPSGSPMMPPPPGPPSGSAAPQPAADTSGSLLDALAAAAEVAAEEARARVAPRHTDPSEQAALDAMMPPPARRSVRPPAPSSSPDNLSGGSGGSAGAKAGSGGSGNGAPAHSARLAGHTARDATPPAPSQLVCMGGPSNVAGAQGLQLQARAEPSGGQLPGPSLTHVQGQLSCLYNWYVSNKNMYLEQTRAHLTKLEQKKPLLLSAPAGPGGAAAAPRMRVDMQAVCKAVEVAIQIMQASMDVEVVQGMAPGTSGHGQPSASGAAPMCALSSHPALLPAPVPTCAFASLAAPVAGLCAPLAQLQPAAPAPAPQAGAAAGAPVMAVAQGPASSPLAHTGLPPMRQQLPQLPPSPLAMPMGLQGPLALPAFNLAGVALS